MSSHTKIVHLNIYDNLCAFRAGHLRIVCVKMSNRAQLNARALSLARQ